MTDRNTPIDAAAPAPSALWLGPEAYPEVTTAYPDPTAHWRKEQADITLGDVSDACGLLPQFFLDACSMLAEAEHARLLEGASPATDLALTAELAQHMAACYQYSWPSMPEDSKVDPDTGVYTYPGDPDLHPIVSIKHPCRATMLVYQYGILAVRVGAAEFLIARMD